MITRHVKIDELLRRDRAGSVAFHAALRVDGVPLTLLLTAAEHESLLLLQRSGMPLVLMIAPESAS